MDYNKYYIAREVVREALPEFKSAEKKALVFQMFEVRNYASLKQEFNIE